MRSCSCHGQSLWRMLCLLPWRALLSKNDLSNSATSPGVCLANPARRKKDTQGTKFSPCVSFHCFFLSFFCFGGWVWRVGVKWAVQHSKPAIFFLFFTEQLTLPLHKRIIFYPPRPYQRCHFYLIEEHITHSSIVYFCVLCAFAISGRQKRIF